MVKIKLITKKVLLFFLILLATLLYLEIGVRLLSPNTYGKIADRDQLVKSIHKKNFSGFIWSSELKKDIFIRTTSLGFIGDDYPLDKPADTIRIAFLGNSMIEALQVDYYNSFIKLLESSLNTSGVCKKKIEILNFGIGGKTTSDNYLVYQKFASLYHPDFVILGSVDDNLANATINYNLDNYNPPYGHLKSWLYKSDLLKLLISKFSQILETRSLLEKFRLIETKDSKITNNKKTDTASSTQADSDTNKDLVTFTDYIITKLNQKITNTNGKLMVLFFPLTKNDRPIYAPERIFNMDDLSVYIKSQGIVLLDPSREFLAAEKSQGCLYSDCNGHLNEVGHQVMAKYLFQYFSSLLANDSICK
jgi:hypothetical protein